MTLKTNSGVNSGTYTYWTSAFLHNHVGGWLLLSTLAGCQHRGLCTQIRVLCLCHRLIHSSFSLIRYTRGFCQPLGAGRSAALHTVHCILCPVPLCNVLSSCSCLRYCGGYDASHAIKLAYASKADWDGRCRLLPSLSYPAASRLTAVRSNGTLTTGCCHLVIGCAWHHQLASCS